MNPYISFSSFNSFTLRLLNLFLFCSVASLSWGQVILTVDQIPVDINHPIQILEGDNFDKEIVFTYFAANGVGTKPDLFDIQISKDGSVRKPGCIDDCNSGNCDTRSVVLEKCNSSNFPNQAKGALILRNLRSGTYDLWLSTRTAINNGTTDERTDRIRVIILKRIRVSKLDDINIESNGSIVSWNAPELLSSACTGQNCTADNINGFYPLITFQGSNYYLSNNVYRWEDANQLIQNTGGHFACIETVTENDFLTAAIVADGNNKVYIGLSDADDENNCQWANGAEMNYNNMESGFGGDSENNDFAAIQSWNGKWALQGAGVYAKAILEVPCSPDYSVRLLTNTAPGQFFGIGTHLVSYETTDECNNIDTTSFHINITGTIQPPASYCEPSSQFPWHEWISQVQFGDIDNSSSRRRYNFFQMSTDVKRDNIYSISLKNTYSWITHKAYWRVWIDYNQDGLFSSEEIVVEKTMNAPTPSSLASMSFNEDIKIPPTAQLGSTRMRIAMKRGAMPEPCESLPFGEMEDYLVNILSDGSNLSLPVTFDLQAQKQGHQSALTWQSNLASFIDHFAIERSNNGGDFKTIKRIPISTLDFGLQQFSWIDESPLEGKNEYRIKQFYDTENLGATEIRQIDFEDMPSFTIFPNPSKNHCYIDLSLYQQEDLNIQLFNQYGQRILTKTVSQLGDRFIKLDLSEVANGAYFVYLNTASGLKASKKIIVVKE